MSLDRTLASAPPMVARDAVPTSEMKLRRLTFVMDSVGTLSLPSYSPVAGGAASRYAPLSRSHEQTSALDGQYLALFSPA